MTKKWHVEVRLQKQGDSETVSSDIVHHIMQTVRGTTGMNQ